MQPGGALAAEYHSDGEGVMDRPMTRAKILAGVPAGPWLAWRRAKRRKTSEIVTMIEMMMRTMMIQVWSRMGLAGRLGSEKAKHTGSAVVGDRVGQYLCKIEEYATSLVENLNSWFDLQILAHGDVEWVKGWFALPEEVGDIEHIRCWWEMLVWNNVSPR